MEHLVAVLGLGALAGVITWAGNEFFAQGWGLPVFLLIWIIGIVVTYGGFLILDDDVF